MSGLTYPVIDPVLIEIGPLAVRWYALAYIAGLLLGWRYMRLMAGRAPRTVTGEQIDDFLFYATLGVILGGRIGYVLFYRFDAYLSDPLLILKLWQGGMAFHGGMLGMLIATWWFCRRRRVPVLSLGDMVCAAVPIGLFFGRIANFINAELYGRITDGPMGMAFPLYRAGEIVGWTEPRHPSQLYEAALEGALLFALLFVLGRRESSRARPGFLAGLFFAGYGIARFVAELFRAPDAHIGFPVFALTMGQLLSIPMVAFGAFLIHRALRRAAVAGPGA